MKKWYGQLADDLFRELKCERLDAVIISGDVGNFSEAAEYKGAKLFLDKLCKKFSIDASHLIIVPGNHNINWKDSKKGCQL